MQPLKADHINTNGAIVASQKVSKIQHTKFFPTEGKTPYGEDISSDLFLNCLALFMLDRRGLIDASRSAWVDHVREHLKELLTFKARAVCDRNRGFDCSDERPGFVHYRYANVQVFFPWLIVDDLPPQNILNYLVQIATKIKACSLSFMCLSGSTLYFNALRCISDIDFLEYEHNPQLDPRHIRNSVDIPILAQRDNFIQYITDTPFYGPIEVTNKIVYLDNSQVGLAASPRSSAYQEAPLTHTPRELHDPIALGQYIQRLAEQTISLLRKEPAKIAKRLLPLSRIIEHRKMAELIINAFDSNTTQDALRVSQKLDIIRKIQTKMEEPIQKFAALAKRDISVIRNGESDVNALTDAEKELIKNLNAELRSVATKNYKILRVFSGA